MEQIGPLTSTDYQIVRWAFMGFSDAFEYFIASGPSTIGNASEILIFCIRPTNPATEIQLLKQPPPIFEMPSPELRDMFQHDTATIEQNHDADRVVTAYASGAVLTAVQDYASLFL